MFKKYKPFFKAGMINSMAYKSAIIGWFFITIIEVLCTLFLWFAIYKNATSPVINGFTFREIIAYFIFSNILSFCIFGGDTGYRIDKEITEGTICMSFTKPISYRGKNLAIALGIIMNKFLMIGLPLTLIAYTIFILTGIIQFVSVWALLFSLFSFLILVLCSIIISDSLEYFTGICCFYTTSGWGLNLAKNSIVGFLGGASLPLAFFKFGKIDFSIVLNYLPFAGMIQNPILALLGDYSQPQTYLLIIHTIGLSITWIFLLELINAIFFKIASKKVTVQGG